MLIELVSLMLAMYAASIPLTLLGRRISEVLCVSSTGFALIVSIIALSHVYNLAVKPLVFADGLLVLDPIACWGLIVVSLIGFVEALYSTEYVRYSGVLIQRFKLYYLLYMVTMLAMTLSALSNNIVLMWVSIEATTLSTAVLVGIYESTTSIEAAWKYVIVCGVGVFFALFGTLLLYDAALMAGMNALDAMSWISLVEGVQRVAKFNTHLLMLAILLVVVGYLAKAGVFPLHVWLPDAHSEAPSPISAILSSVVVKCAIIVLLRYYAIVIRAQLSWFIAPILICLGLLSMFIGGFSVLVQDDIKRMLAYSTVDQVGVIVAALGAANPLGILAAIIHIVYHAIAKSLAFMSSGIVSLRLKGVRSIRSIGGLINRGLGLVSVLMIIAILGVMATPPDPSFYSKFYLFLAMARRGGMLAVITLIAILVSEAALAYKLLEIVFGPIKVKLKATIPLESYTISAKRVKRNPRLRLSIASCIILTLILLSLFILVSPYISLAKTVVVEVIGSSNTMGWGVS